MARINAEKRRLANTGPCEGFTLCLDEGVLVMSGPRKLRLTRLEVKLLAYLAGRDGREVSKADLLRDVWGYAPTTSTHTVQTHIWRLRRKAALAFPDTVLIRTGERGYVLNGPLCIVRTPAGRSG